ncbi:MAG: N-acetyl-1-D-myo-inositol-2-amino-2-deoxy-alpha-D-glucopyranoside deacetylase [Actinomycetota bacterium]|nr:MAG: N-acetyl-1-D-myo-inositol-2-amino-2-deoxy-alpha-D-glucopyranoside deacetylase [Actinomycetota bacterium]
MTAQRRILFVHAHPDDECIGSGVTMARYVSEGAHVALVTCTLGEEGEVLVPELAHLASSQRDELGPHRAGELAASMAILGITDWQLLGAPGRYRDSGMMGTASNDHPDSFWRSDILAAASDLVEVLRSLRPQVVVTYDDYGAYGHPDHIQAHRVTTYAVALAAAPSFRPDLGAAWDVPKVYWTAIPRSRLRESVVRARELGLGGWFSEMDPDDLPLGCDDDAVTSAIVAPEHVEAKMAALAAHATQVTADDVFFLMYERIGPQTMSTEYFRLVRGTAAGERDERGHETDLFAGVA